MEDKRTAGQSKDNAGLHSFDDEPDPGPPPTPNKGPGTFGVPELASFDDPAGPPSGGGKTPGTYSTPGDSDQ